MHRGPTVSLTQSLTRAGGNGTAGTAMAVPDLRQKKWRRLDCNLRMRYRHGRFQTRASPGIARVNSGQIHHYIVLRDDGADDLTARTTEQSKPRV